MRWSILLLLVVACVQPAYACELCNGPGPGFTAIQEHIERWPRVALGEPMPGRDQGRVRFRITEPLKGDLTKGTIVVAEGRIAVLPQRVWLLMAPETKDATWSVLMLRPAVAPFVRAAHALPPASKLDARLEALVPWLAHGDPMVAASARKAFAAAPFTALQKAARDIPAAELVRLLGKPETAPASRGALFLMLGATGGGMDRRAWAKWLREPSMQRAQGYDALIAAWLMRTGTEGLGLLEDMLREGRTGDPAIVGTALVRALGFHGRNDAGLAKSDVRASLGRLLSVTPIIGATVGELIRLEGWDQLAAVRSLYESRAAKAPWIVGPILRYLQAHPGDEAAALRKQIEARLWG